MKYFGIAVFIFGVGVFVKSYISYLKKKQAECEAFLSLVCYMKIQIGCFMRSPKELISGFRCDALEKAGFLTEVENCSDMGEAYRKIRDRLSLSDKESVLLDGLFSSLGEVYYEESVRLLDTAQGELEVIVKSEREAAIKNTRLLSALSTTAALAVIMLII